jgi:hypothetical protein
LLGARARGDLDATCPECLFERVRHVLIGSRQDPRGILEERDPTAEVGQDRRELAAGVGGPDDAHVAGQGGQASDVLEGEGMLRPRNREARGAAADGDDDPVCAPGSAVRRGDRHRVDEPCVARPLDDVDAHRADAVGHVLALVRVAGDPLGIGKRRGEVDLRSGSAQAERLPRTPVPDEPRRSGQRADRRGTIVQRGSANPAPLDERDLGSQLRGLKRGGHAGRAAPENQDPHVVCCHRRTTLA